MDGVEVCKVTRQGFVDRENKSNTYLLDIPKEALGNNSCRLRVKVKSGDKSESYGIVMMVMK